MAVAASEPFVGSSVKRKEDESLLRGRGTFVDNLTLPGTLSMVVVRSPYPHARITGVNLDAARAFEGVVAAFSGADLADDWTGGMPCAWPVTEDIKMPPHYPLASEEARYQGDGVAVVVAESRAIAKDAAELVEVDYEPLDALADVEKALAEGAPLVHADLETNECYVWKLETDDVQAAIDAADVVVTRRYFQPRLIPNAMEPRAVLAQVGPAGEVTLWSATQVPHILRFTMQLVLGIPESKMRVIAPDVGGGFGSKCDVYAEDYLAVALAKRLGRPVKWTEERAENYVATIHGRDVVHELTFAATKDGKITAVKSEAVCAMGAYLQLVTPGIPLLGAWIYSGPYAIPNYSVTFTGVFTHTTPTDAYRGAGRPEATYVLERTMDALAAELGLDPVELRRRNFVEEFPYTMASGLTIDAGDYQATLGRLLELLDLDSIRADQETRRSGADTKQIGVGFSTYNEMCGLAPSRILGAIRYAVGGWESATIRFQPLGSVQVVTGTSPHGQGHETTWAQIVADQLGIEVDDVEVLHGDTAVSQQGMDSYGSRSLTVGGIALWHAGREDHRQGARDRCPSARGVRGRPRVLERRLQREGITRPQHDDPGGRVRGPLGAQPPRRDGAWPRGDRGVRPAQLLLAGRCARRRGRGGHRDRRCTACPLRRGRRRRRPGEPDDHRRPGARRHHAGDRSGALRGGRVRRGREPADDDDDDVPRAVRGRASLVRDRSHRDAGGQPARGEGRGGDRNDRGGAGGHQRRRRRAVAPRRHRHPASRDARTGVAGDRGGEVVIPASFDYEVAESVDHALALLGEREDAKLLAGGHSLLPAMKLRIARPSLPHRHRWARRTALREGRRRPDRHRRRDPAQGRPDAALLQEHCPIVSSTAGQVGDPQVRHRGTIGGSICHSDPASDLPAVLFALDAEMVVRGDGERIDPRPSTSAPVSSRPPCPPARCSSRSACRSSARTTGWSYVKMSRRAQDWATVGVAAVVERSNGSISNAAIALTNMGATPVRARAAEEAIAGGASIDEAAALISKDRNPPSDHAASSEFRKHLAEVLGRRALNEASAG